MLQQRQLFFYFNPNKDVNFLKSAFKHFNETSNGVFSAQNYLENFLRQITQEKVLVEDNRGLPINPLYGTVSVCSTTSSGKREWGIVVGEQGTSTIIHYREF